MKHMSDEYRKELAKLDKATKELHNTINQVQEKFSLQQLIEEC